MSAYSDLILGETALQSYWRLGETVGSGTVADSGPGAITGTVFASVDLGATSLLTTDPSNTAASFTDEAGGNDRIDFGNVYPFTGTAPFSCEMWIKPDALASTPTLIANGLATADCWGIHVFPTGKLRVRRLISAAQIEADSATGLISVGNIYHIVGTYDGTNIRGYINGQLVATSPTDTRSQVDPGQTLRVGSQPGGGSRYDGIIDEVAIYNDDLTLTQIAEHYGVGVEEEEPTTLHVNQPPIVIGG